MSFWRVGTSVLAISAAGPRAASVTGTPEGNPNYSISFTAVTQPTPIWPQTVWVKATVSGPGIPTPTTYNDQQTAQWAFWWSDLEPTSAWVHFTGPLSWMSDARVMPGRWAAHCPSTPGAKSWRCTAMNMADWSQWTTAVYSFTVADPSTEFTAAQTFVISPTSNWGVFPAHNAGNRYTSWDTFRTTALNPATGRIRIFLERGQTYTASGGNGLGAGTTHVWIGAAGTGARPVMNLNAGVGAWLFDVQGRQIWVSDIVVNGPVPVDSAAIDNSQFMFSNATGNTHLIVRNCALRNLGTPMQFQQPCLAQYSFVDCEVEGWIQAASLNTGIAGDTVGTGGYACYRGHRIVQTSARPSAPSDAENNNWNGGFGHRDAGFDVFVVDALDGFGRSGWFPNLSPSDRRSLQATMRLGVSAGGYMGISRAVNEGGMAFGTNGLGSAAPADVLVDSCYWVLAGGQNRNAFVCALTGVSVRNNTVVIPPGLKITGEAGIFQTPSSAEPAGYIPNLATVQATPNTYLNTTVVMLEDSVVTGAAPPIVNAPGNGMTVSIANTAWYRPFVSPLDEGPFDLARAANPRMTGWRDNRVPNRGSMLVTGRSGNWNEGTNVGGVAIDAAIGSLVMLEGIPSPTIPLGAVSTSGGGTGTVTLASHSHEAITSTPWFRLDFDGLTSPFHIGSILTNGTATARIQYVQYSGSTGTLWLGPITGGAFSDNQTITDNRTGSAVANGGQSLNIGVFASMRPLSGSPVIGAATGTLIPPRDQSGQMRPALASRGAMELAL